jgi:calcium-binding protein CML
LGLPQLEVTFDRIADAFVFFDKDGDGYVSKKEIVEAIGQASPGSRHANRIGLKRFGEGLAWLSFVKIYAKIWDNCLN